MSFGAIPKAGIRDIIWTIPKTNKDDSEENDVLIIPDKILPPYAPKRVMLE